MILSKKAYSMDALRIAAQVLSSKVDVYLDEDKNSYDVTLEPKRKDADKAALEGEFRNELLNQEYRFVVGAFNRKISSLIVTQALMAARGGENPPPAVPPEEKTPEFKAKVAELMKAAEDEIKRTMPKKLPHQGQPIPPQKEDAGV
jgi:His-Xaa-Ser system protein HxsD